MKTITIYECETCHTQYDTSEKATDCEQNHRTPSSVAKCFYKSGVRYPEHVNITFSDGKTCTYVRKTSD